jgi:transposase
MANWMKSASRSSKVAEIKHVEAALGLTPVERACLLSDGYHAYAHYAKKTGLTHAQCWAHTRRKLFEAQDVEPEAAAQALDFIGELYAWKKRIREQEARRRPGKRDYRLMHAKPIVERFFAWVNEQFEAQGLLPSNPLTKALAYARERRCGLEVYLTDPDVPIDTNHLERACGRFRWVEKTGCSAGPNSGPKHVGIIQSLIVTCRLHQIDPYDYLVDVLQRVGQHPASARPGTHARDAGSKFFAPDPLRSPLLRLST